MIHVVGDQAELNCIPSRASSSLQTRPFPAPTSPPQTHTPGSWLHCACQGRPLSQSAQSTLSALLLDQDNDKEMFPPPFTQLQMYLCYEISVWVS